MKKHLWLPILFLICSSAIYGIKENYEKQAVNKNISFVVHRSSDYRSSIYNNASVQLQVTVEKISGTKRTLVWDKVFETRLLRAYPASDSAFAETLTVPNVHDSKEHLEVTYTRIYNSNGYELQIQNYAVIDQNFKTMDISI